MLASRALTPRALPILLVLVAPYAAAQSLEVLGPTGPVPPDGFPVALLRRGGGGVPVAAGSASLSAEGADLRAMPPLPPLQTFLAVPRPGAREVRIIASDGSARVERRFPVGPPAARVELALSPAQPVKGRDQQATLTVKLLKPDGSPDPDSAPPVLRANVGRIEGLEPTGPGSYRAQYVLPQTRYPEVAIVAALAPWPHPLSIHGAFGRLLVPLASSIDLPGRTEPNSEMSIEIAGKRFGPVRAGPDGRFQLPVIVPPGHRFGQGLAVDRLGNKRRAKIDLMLPPTDQLACVMNPPRLPADGISRARILCATSDAYGTPVSAARVSLDAQKGSVAGPRAIEGGILEWIYSAPKTTQFTPDVLQANWPQAGKTSREELQVQLDQGPATQLALDVPEALVHRGSTLPLELSVRDAFDRPRPGALLDTQASAGTISAFEETGPGQFRGTFTPPPEAAVTRATVRARAFGPVGSGPARLWAWTSGGKLFAAVSDLAGLPVPSQRLRLGGKVIITGADGTVELGDAKPGTVELAHDDWPGLHQTLFVLDEATVFPAGRAPGSDARSVEVVIAPPAPVNVRVSVSGRRVTYWVEDPQGRVLAGRKVEIALSAGRAGARQPAGEQKTSFEVTTDRPATVAVSDAETGVTAVAEVKP